MFVFTCRNIQILREYIKSPTYMKQVCSYNPHTKNFFHVDNFLYYVIKLNFCKKEKRMTFEFDIVVMQIIDTKH